MPSLSKLFTQKFQSFPRGQKYSVLEYVDEAASRLVYIAFDGRVRVSYVGLYLMSVYKPLNNDYI